MILLPEEELKKEAFRLFEDGRYIESLDLCRRILETARDPAIEILTATNLYYAGKFEDAAVFFRDLARSIPESSYVHSYLAKILEAQGNEGAITEWGIAVRLDLTNQEALRGYAGYLCSRKDYRATLPVQKQLVSVSGRPEDMRQLVRLLVWVGDPQEAIDTCKILGADCTKCPEYVDALMLVQDYRTAADLSYAAYCETHDTAMLRKYLSALSHYDLPAAFEGYTSHLSDNPDTGILFDYILLLSANKKYEQALDVTRRLLPIENRPQYRLIECGLYAAQGNNVEALTGYERLIADELKTKEDLDTLRIIVGNYRRLLLSQCGNDEALLRFRAVVSGDLNVVSLTGTAELCEDLGEIPEARSWYYRAYRADYLTGGLPYARFLALNDEVRECEKVMIYILTNVKKSADLGRVAAVILDKNGRMSRMKRLLSQLIHRFADQRTALSSEGLELFARAYYLAAAQSLEERDYQCAKYFCLAGMDTLPAKSDLVTVAEFISLIDECKKHAIADRPVMHSPHSRKRIHAKRTAPEIADQLNLTEQEQKIISFLRSHRTTNEMELRKVTGTRRVVGIINRIIAKATAQGIMLIAKKGVGEDGEIYEYSGS